MKKLKQGRPRTKPTQIIRVPIDKLSVVEKIVGRKLVENQTPHVMVRVLVSDVARIRKAIK